MAMTSRERVVASLAHREPDRLPIDHGSFRGTGIMAIAYNRLKEHLGIRTGHTYLYDLILQLAEPEQWYLDRFRVDAIDVGRYFNRPEEWKPWTLPDGSKALAPVWYNPEVHEGDIVVLDSCKRPIATQPRTSVYLDQACWPLEQEGLDYEGPLSDKMKQVMWDAVPITPWDAPLVPERLDAIGAAARHLRENTDYAISLTVGCSIYEKCQHLFGMANTYLYIAAEKQKLAKFVDRLTEQHLAFLEQVLPRIKGYVDVLVVGDDLGTQRGPQMSPSSYREIFQPRHKRIYRYIKDHSDAKVMLHCCGGVYPLIPDLIDAGVDILNPVQTSARDMEPERLKREFGKDITFWGGGCDTQTVLGRGTPSEIRDHVRRRLEIFMPGGGFVFNQVHNVMADVPPENVIAMLDAAYEFGSYT